MLRAGGMKTSITELLTLHEALDAGLAGYNVDDFYFLARACLVKDEVATRSLRPHLRRLLQGRRRPLRDLMRTSRTNGWRRQAELHLSDEELALIEALGGFDALMKALRERLEEQDERHEGGNKWIGTAGTSPFGAYGYNPEGVRIGQKGGRNRAGVKVWDQRQYRNLDDSVELGTRNIKVALRRLRKFAREGAARPARSGGHDRQDGAQCRPARYPHGAGAAQRRESAAVASISAAPWTITSSICEELFSAARSEFKHLEYFYFHNFIYESVWKDNRRRHSSASRQWTLRTSTAPTTNSCSSATRR